MTEAQQKVLQGFKAFYDKANEGKVFKAREMVEFMEPIFREAGCREPADPSRQPHILILRDDAAGDFVLNSAFMREVRRIYPGAHITLFASHRNEELARCCPYIDNLLINDLSFPGNGFWQVFPVLVKYAVETLMPYNFDLAFSGRLGIRSADVLLMYMCGATRRVAFTQDRLAGQGKIARIGWDVMLTVAVPMLQLVQSDLDRDLYMLEFLLQLPIKNRRTEVWTLASDREAAKRALEPLLKERKVKRLYAVMPSTSESFREWPVERFEELLRIITKREKDVGFVIMGGSSDRERAMAMAAKFPHRALSVAGELSFRESAEAVALCEKYIGDDTGLSHLAAAKGVPILNIFPYPASLGLHPMSCPVRFQPYGVPAVVVIPPEPGSEKCKLMHGAGCADREKPCCILGVTVEKMLQGYDMLTKCIKEKRTHALILK